MLLSLQECERGSVGPKQVFAVRTVPLPEGVETSNVQNVWKDCIVDTIGIMADSGILRTMSSVHCMRFTYISAQK